MRPCSVAAITPVLILVLLLSFVPVLGPPAVSLAAAPTVTVIAAQAVASEEGPLPGIFEFRRIGDTSSPLVVNFSLGGTATQGSDYLLWETSARFEPGSATAFVAIMPLNDSLQEGDETVILTLAASADYNVGSPNSATITIHDIYVPNFPGVWTPLNPVALDLRYLDAFISGGFLNIIIGVPSAGGIANDLGLCIFLDSDQNPATGDYRAGHVAGQEFRLDASLGFLAGYQLYQLRTDPPTSPLDKPEDDIYVTTGPGSVDQSGLFTTFQVPLTAIGNPRAVDVFASTNIGTLAPTTPAVGDRAPLYGALSTETRQVVVRRPGATQSIRVQDVVGDNAVNAFDLTAVTFTTVADQFTIQFDYTQFFDPTDLAHFPGPRGEIIFDSDRSLLTGAWKMGGAIPTWGGDMQLSYDLTSVSPLLELHPDTLGNKVPIAADKNDSRWSATNNSLYISGSLSILDAFEKRSSQPRPVRIPTTGHMYFQTWTLPPNIRDVGDAVPTADTVVDTTTGAVMQPISWDPTRTLVALDPQEYPPPAISGQDIIEVDAEVVQESLVLKVAFSSLINTDSGNVFVVALDTDMDTTNRAPLGQMSNPQNGGGSIGVDYTFEVDSHLIDIGSPSVYIAGIQYPDGTLTRNDAMVLPQGAFSAGQPGGFTATIPLATFGANLGPRLRLYVSASRGDGPPGPSDIAPPAPFVVPLQASGLTPTATPTRTRTATPTGTPTPTATSSPTSTATQTRTPTPTTRTASPTATATSTPATTTGDAATAQSGPYSFTLRPGEQGTFDIRFANVGTTIWSSPDYFLNETHTASQRAVALGGCDPLRPGFVCTWRFTLTAGTTLGTDVFSYQMYHQPTGGFGDTITVNLDVVAASPTPTETLTPTLTATSTPTLAGTSSPTATNTVTPTTTPAGVLTSSPTPTGTLRPTSTASPTTTPAGTSTPTRTASPTTPPTDTPTTTQVSNPCASPARIAVHADPTVLPTGGRALHVTVSAQGGNRLVSLEFAGPTAQTPNPNASILPPAGTGSPLTGAFTVSLGTALSGPSTYSFDVVRATPGAPTTLSFVVLDSCGSPWPTVVGGGAEAPF